MKFEWKKVKLGEITSVITKGTTPTSLGYSFTNQGINFIKSESITADKFLDKTKYCHISKETHEKLKRSQLQINDILFSMAGVFLGKTGIVTVSDIPANTNQAVAIIRVIPELADTNYIYYYLNQKNIIAYINSSTGQSAQPNINLKQIGQLEIVLPSIATQKKIASVFNALDDKIALNNKINDNLEQQAQTLYRKYFSEAGNTGELADVCDFSKDKIAVSELSVGNYFSTENMLPDKKGAIEATNLPAVQQTTACHRGNVLVSNIRPYFKKILYCQREGGCSNDVLCFVPKTPELSAYLYCTLYADNFFNFMVAGSKGTKMPRGDKKQIMTYKVCIPFENQLKDFNAAVLPMFQMIENNRRENMKLSLVRDTLLPKLMAGKIDISS